MAQIVIYIPEDLETGKRKESLRRLQNSMTQGLANVLGADYPLPQFATIYRVPMTKDEQPIVAVRLLTHTKDCVDLLMADTPSSSNASYRSLDPGEEGQQTWTHQDAGEQDLAYRNRFS